MFQGEAGLSPCLEGHVLLSLQTVTQNLPPRSLCGPESISPEAAVGGSGSGAQVPPPPHRARSSVCLSPAQGGSVERVRLSRPDMGLPAGGPGDPMSSQMRSRKTSTASRRVWPRLALEAEYGQLSLSRHDILQGKMHVLTHQLLWPKPLGHTRSGPTMSSCSDDHKPCLMVDNYTVSGAAGENHD